MPKDDATVCFETCARGLREQNTQENRLNPAALLPDCQEGRQRAQSNTDRAWPQKKPRKKAGGFTKEETDKGQLNTPHLLFATQAAQGAKGKC